MKSMATAIITYSLLNLYKIPNGESFCSCPRHLVFILFLMLFYYFYIQELFYLFCRFYWRLKMARFHLLQNRLFFIKPFGKLFLAQAQLLPFPLYFFCIIPS